MASVIQLESSKWMQAPESQLSHPQLIRHPREGGGPITQGDAMKTRTPTINQYADRPYNRIQILLLRFLGKVLGRHIV